MSALITALNIPAPDEFYEALIDAHRGLTDAQASAQLHLADGGLAHWVAAARECFEEAGVLLLHGVDAKRAESLLHYRTRPFVELLESEDLHIPADALAYYGRRPMELLLETLGTATDITAVHSGEYC